ncbi:bromodomain-containing protein 2 isoform X2 [Parasteatoda tepidariorum]|uniref:bromodomain-containing protein 2 isoform X2 n=1 Tax=Parasteatoda tepidariorum TaxID=114398 RepID=UPI001C722DFA|nr:bromodomain-containing protein 2 isoform X2 [Parasteatoda tepidariorum]
MATEKRWTLKEKWALSKSIENLPDDDHKHIYRIIKARDPDTLEDCPEGTSIHFTLLRPETLRELEGYVASRSVNTQSEINENNPAEQEEEESSSESTSNTRKSPRRKESEIKENNPAEHEKEESNSKSTSSTRKSPRIKIIESEIKESNPAEHEKEESSSKSTSNTRKSPRGKGATGSAEETGEVSIKARLRGTSKKFEAGLSK